MRRGRRTRDELGQESGQTRAVGLCLNEEDLVDFCVEEELLLYELRASEIQELVDELGLCALVERVRRSVEVVEAVNDAVVMELLGTDELVEIRANEVFIVVVVEHPRVYLQRHHEFDLSLRAKVLIHMINGPIRDLY